MSRPEIAQGAISALLNPIDQAAPARTNKSSRDHKQVLRDDSSAAIPARASARPLKSSSPTEQVWLSGSRKRYIDDYPSERLET